MLLKVSIFVDKRCMYAMVCCVLAYLLLVLVFTVLYCMYHVYPSTERPWKGLSTRNQLFQAIYSIPFL